VEGVMRSAAMLTYGGVARALGFTETPPRSAQAEAFKRDLRVIDELTRKLRRARMKRGALDLDLPEPRVYIDAQIGAPVDVQRRAEDEGVKRAYHMVEELMLLANELVATWLSQRRAPATYRVHAKPDERKLERLGDVARKMGVEFDLAAMLEPNGVSSWFRTLQEHPKKRVLEMLLLRSLKQAVYDIVNIGHFGLASDAYLHFTSPIRRYPDIQVHRAVKHLLRGGKPDTSAGGIEALRASATASSVRERAAINVEREVVDLYRALLMRDRVGDVFEGTVTAVVGSGMFVTLDHPFVDVLVRYEAMGPDYYEQSEDEISVTGQRSGDTVTIGDHVVVGIEDVAVLRRQVYARRLPPKHVIEQSKPGGSGRGRKKAASARGRGADRSATPSKQRGRKTRGAPAQHAGPKPERGAGRKKRG